VSDTLQESDRAGSAPHPRETTAFTGHAVAERAVLEAYRAARMPHAWIIGGAEGIGKATLAWRIARFLLANPDPSRCLVQQAATLHVDPMSSAARQLSAMSCADLVLLRREWNEKVKKLYTEIRVEDVRRATRVFQHAAGGGGWRIAIVDSADDLNRNAANALLKIIEEPPARSLFLLVAHRPGRLIATLRSRCRVMMLEPLSGAQVVDAIEAIGPPFTKRPRNEIEAAAAGAGGSVKRALRLLEPQSGELDAHMRALLARLPQVDWGNVHALGEAVAGRDNELAYESVMTRVFDYLDQSVREGAAQGPARLAPYAEVWEKVVDASRETEVLNLDKRPLILSIFAELAAAVRAAQH
jgi:DNA polymerase-3 subunit delta'